VLWAAAAAGLGVQVFTSSGTFTPTTGKTTFLVFCTGGGGGSGYADMPGDVFNNTIFTSAGGGAGGTGIRLYNATEMGSSAVVTIGAGGSRGNSSGQDGGNGGTSSFNPAGTGVTVEGNGGGGSSAYGNGDPGGTGGGYSGAQFGNTGGGGASVWRTGNNLATSSYPDGPKGGSGLFGGNGAEGSSAGPNFRDDRPGNAGSSGVVVIFEL
jgi:hypothetical protein